MRFERRSDRPHATRRRTRSNLETLERRELLSLVIPAQFQHYRPTDFPPRVVNHHSPWILPSPGFAATPRQLSFLDNDGKVVMGKDRLGNEWIITVHGPGAVIVTDATPNDGVLADDIDTIKLVGTSLTETFVTGQVTSSARVLTDGNVRFNRLIAEDGVASIILNGFTLAPTVDVPPDQVRFIEPEIFLPGGVGLLQFNNIEAPFDLSRPSFPFQIVIGDPTTPLTTKPSIRIGSIFNTVFDPAAPQPLPGPNVFPTVQIVVNGEIQSLDIVSATAAPIEPTGNLPLFPLVGVTGRTAVRAMGIDTLNVHGTARNFTASRGAFPFNTGFSSLSHIGTASFGGTADGVGLDVTEGRIGRLRFARGLGDPTGTSPSLVDYGFPASQVGFAGSGLLGGLVTAREIGSISAGPANAVLQTTQDPNFIQERRQGMTTFFPRPGNALTRAAIVSSGSIGAVDVLGDAVQSEIRSGFHYPSYFAGLEPTRAPSRIGPVLYRGNLIDSVVAASYRPVNAIFGDHFAEDDEIREGEDIAGPGLIRGNMQHGRLFQTGQRTALDNEGAGFFARRKVGYLPPPQRPARIHGVLVV